MKLSPEKAFIFRITHIDNTPWLLTNGVQCRSSGLLDPNFVEIGCPDLIDKRQNRKVPIPPGGTLSDYVPFYFTPLSPMLLNIKTGRNGVKKRHMSEIVVLVSSLRHCAESGASFVFTNRHAITKLADYYSDLDKLDEIDWPSLRARDFKRDSDGRLQEPGVAEPRLFHVVGPGGKKGPWHHARSGCRVCTNQRRMGDAGRKGRARVPWKDCRASDQPPKRCDV
jgi:hypothetical protein